MDEAGGKLRGASEGFRDSDTGGGTGCCNVDRAERNRFTCFLRY